MGAAQHPAITAAREMHIRPKRKLRLRSARKQFFMPVRAPFSKYQSYKLVYGDYSVTGRICQWVAKNKSYKTTSLVFDNSRHITYNGKNIIKKRDEGMSTPICGRTESLYLLREDRFRNMVPEQRG